MAIDIFGIEPSVITRDLSGKSFLIYGAKKSGKTSTAVKFPRPLLMGFEKGYNMLSGVKAQPINTWAEALTVKKQLLKDTKDVETGTAKNKDGTSRTETYYKSVIVDTADLAYDMCEKHILLNEGVQYLDETEDKRGYKAVKREYDSFFQDICRAGYTLIAISHSATVQVKEAGVKYDRTQPTLEKRALEVLSRLVDIIAYSTPEYNEETGITQTWLYMRGSKELEAGSRNAYTSEKILFTYEALRDDMAQAVDRLEAEGAMVVNTPTKAYQPQTEKLDFNEVFNEIKIIAKALNKASLSDKYLEVVTNRLGKGRNVKDCDESQVEILGLILDDLRDIVVEQGVLLDEA